MNAELWTRVTEIFDKALECPAAEREYFLQRVCGANETLRGEVERLLGEFEKAGDFLEPVSFLAQSLAIGERIAGRYRIERLLGRGGMGEVYSAHDELVDELIALKTLRSDLNDSPDIVKRLQRELQLARKVTHPNVCRVFDVGVHEQGQTTVHFFTMQLLEGETLAEHIKRRGSIPCDEVEILAIQMADGLSAAHKSDVIHRDFKSANVIIHAGKAIITDFGLARLEPTGPVGGGMGTISRSNQISGTIAYMSPEQLSGDKVTAASDIYSLGIVLFEMTTGKLPFDGKHIIQSAMQRVADAAPDVRGVAPSIHPNMAAVIARCLQRDPSRRFANATEVSNQLRKRAWRPPMLYWNRRQWTKAAMASAISIGGAALISVTYRFNTQNTTLPEGAEALLGPITNSTDESNLDATTELMRNQLSQSVHLTFIDQANIDAVLKQMQKPEAAAEPAVLREAAWRLNAAVSVFGNVSRVGPDYALSIQLETRGSQPDVPRSKSLKSFSAPDSAGLMHAVRDASLWVRETLGESRTDIASFDRLPENATTPSWQALALFARGQQHFMKNDFDPAILEFASALQEDPKFTLAAIRRADLLMSQNRHREGLAQWRSAINMLRERPVTRAEELYARAMYAYDTGDVAGADRQYQTWSIEYPGDWHPLFYRVTPLILNGHAGQAVKLLESLRKRMPDYGDIYAQLISCHIVLNQTSQAREWMPELRKRGRPERADLREGYIRFREGDCVGYFDMLQKVQASKTYRRGAVDAMVRECLLWLDVGMPEIAAERSARFLHHGSWAETVAEEAHLLAVQAWGEMESGHPGEAVLHASQAIQAETPAIVVAIAGTVFARAGVSSNVERALALCADFDDMPVFRLARFRILGERERAQGNIDKAIEYFRHASELEPLIAHRAYLRDTLPENGAERMELCRRAVNVPWQVFRPPPLHNIGSLHGAVKTVKRAGSADSFVQRFLESSERLKMIV